MQEKNILISKGNNYYLDFEIAGVGHPARDLASLIIHNPKKREEIISVYRKNISFDYKGIEKDIRKWFVARVSQLILILKTKKIPNTKNKKIEKNLFEAMNFYLQ